MRDGPQVGITLLTLPSQEQDGLRPSIYPTNTNVLPILTLRPLDQIYL